MLGQAIKYFILNSQSIIIIIFIQYLFIKSLITKLIKMFFYFQSRISSGFKNPLYILCEVLAY